MFQLDQDITISRIELQHLAENWEKLAPEARQNILQVMNCDKSDEFYKGALAAYYAAARLMSDKNYPEASKEVVIKGSAGLLASKLAYGEWPPQ